MADPAGDVERLRAVLDLCSEKGIRVARVRVGGVEVTVTHPPPASPDGTRPASTETPAEREERAKQEFLETMYAGSIGDLPEFGES